MAFLGNLEGPRESVIVERLGAGYFGISEEGLASDVEWFRNGELRGEVQPVCQDDDGRYYIVLGGDRQRFYLDEHGYMLTGTVAVMAARDAA